MMKALRIIEENKMRMFFLILSISMIFFTGTAVAQDDTIGLYDPSNAGFHLKNSNTQGSGADIVFAYGPANQGWIPIVGDWDGKGKNEVGLYDPQNAGFHLRDSNDLGGGAYIVFAYGPGGNQGWMPIVGDWDGDGIDTVGLYDPANAGFHLKNSHTGGAADIVFAFGPGGNRGWIPIAGDWNKDNIDTVGLYDPANAGFHLKNSHAGGAADEVFAYGPGGNRGWRPIVGDWNRDSIDTVGLYDPANAGFHLKNSHAGGSADIVFTFGPGGNRGWKPIVGDWAGANWIRVPQDYSTIQTAVNAAAPGGMIIDIAPGLYEESITITDKPGITLRGNINDYNDPLDFTVNTVIDCNGSKHAITIRRSNNTKIDSLVITGANGGYHTDRGGGIYNYASNNVRISSNIIIDNRTGYGAGIYSRTSKRVIISNNLFTENDGHWGGAISIIGYTQSSEYDAIIIGNDIIDNYAWASGAGIGINSLEEGRPQRPPQATVSIVNNRIYNNQSDWGAGIYADTVQGEIKNNIIVANYADYKEGGGIYCLNCSALIANNVIHNNKVAWGDRGGGIFIEENELSPVIKNNIITENGIDGLGGTGGIAISRKVDTSTLVLEYNNVYNNHNGDLCCEPGIGSISEDPLFTAPDDDNNPYNDDYRLLQGSPCIDTGDPARQFNDPDGTRNDMGAYGGPQSF